MLCGQSILPSHAYAWQESALKTANSQDRLSAPIKSKHLPEAYSKIWNFLAIPGSAIASETDTPELRNVQQPYFFGGTGSMKTCQFEPDVLGSLRMFTSGKIRVQFFNAKDLNLKDMVGKTKKDVPVQEAIEENVKDMLLSSFKSLPKSERCVIDCSNGPQALIIPPGFIVVQEAMDGKPSCGVRRSYTPTSKSQLEVFELVANPDFALKSKICSAMNR